MPYFVDIDINNKVVGVKQVNEGYVNHGNSIEIQEHDTRLMGTTYTNGKFDGYYSTLSYATGKARAALYNYLDQLATGYANLVTFDCGGVQQTATPVNGVAEIDFTNATLDPVTVKTVGLMRNGEVVV